MLNTIDRLIAVDLFLRHRVVAMPFQQERKAVCRQIGRSGRVHLGSVTVIQDILTITCRHIEERPCEITFVAVVGFVALAYSGRSRRA